VVAAMALGFLAGAYLVQHFAMSTDSLDLVSPDSAWRRNKATFDREFPQLGDLMVVVVDGATPELADHGAAALAGRLSQQADLFRSVRQPDGGPFFDRNGLLFLPGSDVATVTQQLIGAQPLLGPLAADPSLRGVMGALSTVLEGVEHGETDLGEIGGPLRAISDALERVVKGEPAFFSWRTLISGEPATGRETRRIVLAKPRVDTTVLRPGAEASGAIRRAAGELHLDADDGVRVRLTGPVALADDELATLADHVGLTTGAMVVAVLFMLWLAVRSARIIACILLTTLLGLALTAGVGLLAVGRFTLISIAFIPLFVGLGIDFAIQFSVDYRAERFLYRDARVALIAAGSRVGGALALAAAAVAVGFFAFLPTDYIGASELGLIAGIGMIIAFLLSVTLLPALLTLARAPAEPAAVDLASLAPLDRFLSRRRKLVLAAGGVSGAVSLALLPLLRFDANPLDLRSPNVESVSTLLDLMSDPDRTPNTIDILAPSLAEANRLAERISAMPEVARAVTLTNFVPDDQPEKLRLIDDAATLLDVALHPIEMRAPPTDAETAAQLARTAEALRRGAGDRATPAAKEARRLSAILDRLATAPPALRERASQTLIHPLTLMLDRLRTMLRPQPVTLQTLPPELVRDWVAGDGRARIQVSPKGDANDDEILRRFARAMQATAPDATGAPISILEAAGLIVHAFVQAGIWSVLAITLLLAVVLRRARDVVLTLVPILLTGLLTLASCVLIGQPLNFANIIALPLLFGIGVAFNIYFVMAWRSGRTNLLRSSLARAVLFSALTTGTAFGSLWFSSHPGTASMGRLLLISLAWTLATALLFEPALLGPLRRRAAFSSPIAADEHVVAVEPGASAQRSPPLPHGEAPRAPDAEVLGRDEEASLLMRPGPPAKGDET